MAAIRRTIDPATRDYVAVAGDYQDDGSSVKSKALFLWRLQRGSAAAFPALGSRFHLIETVSEAGLRAAEKYAREAWTPLVEDREMTIISITASKGQKPGVISLRGEYRDRAGHPDVLGHSVLVGSR